MTTRPSLTIITHGYGSSGERCDDPTKGCWVNDLAAAISARESGNSSASAGGDVPIYRLVLKENSELTGAVRDNAITEPLPASFANNKVYQGDGESKGSAIVIVDWSDVDAGWSGINAVPTLTIAGLIRDYLAESPDAMSLPIHLIGHSRGGSVMLALADLLFKQGIIVEQLTTLDPHPLPIDFEGLKQGSSEEADPLIDNLILPANVIFADSYRQIGEHPYGHKVDGASNTDLTSSLDSWSNGLMHGQVHAWYHFATDLDAIKVDGVDLGTSYFATINPRDAVGFNISRHLKGIPFWVASKKYGLNDKVGGGGTRYHVPITTALDITMPTMPSIVIEKSVTPDSTMIGPLAISVGQQLTLSVYYSAPVNPADILISLDDDMNPFNAPTDLVCQSFGQQMALSVQPTPSDNPIQKAPLQVTLHNPNFTEMKSCFVRVTIKNNFNPKRIDYVQRPITILPDTTDPTISSISPVSNAIGASVNIPITATFSESMTSLTISTSTFTLKDSSNNSVSGSVTYSGTTATFTPIGGLSYNATYTATVTTGVKDASGNAMASNYSWSFTTDAAPAISQTIKPYYDGLGNYISTFNMSGEINGNVSFEGGTLNIIDGQTLTITGNFIHSGGTLNVNGGKLIVKGDYRIQILNADGTYSNSTGYLKMINSADYVLVEGSFVMDSSNNHNTYLTAGTLEVKGDFTQKSSCGGCNSDVMSFYTSGTHKVILSGTGKQTVRFEDPNSSYSHFTVLEITNASTDGVVFATALNVTTLTSNGKILNPMTVSTMDWSLTANETIAGDLKLGGAILNLNGKTLTITGNLIHSGGTLYVNGGKLIVKGDYRIQKLNADNVTYTNSTGYLKMVNTADYVEVHGSFVMDSSNNHNTYLTAGTLEVKGDFTQKSSCGGCNSDVMNFYTSGTHKVILSGTGKQTVSFEDPNSSYSHFTILEITNASTDGVVFATKVVVTKLFQHNRKNFTVTVSTSEFPDYDGDGYKDNIDSHPEDNTLYDITAPSGTISITNPVYTNTLSITLVLTCTDAVAGCAKMQFSNDNVTYSTAEAYATSKTWTLSSGDGTKTVYVQFKDAVGNVSGSYSDTIIFDTTSPEFTSTAPSADSLINTASVGYTLSEQVASGNITFMQTGGTADPLSPHIYNLAAPDMTAGTHTVNTGLSLVSGAIYTVTFEATDLAGNVATPISGTNVSVDTTTASVTINTPSSGSVTNNVSVGYTLSEAISSGNIVFTSTGGNADAGSPHTYTLAGTELTAGAHSITTGMTLVDGAVYTVSIENVFDAAGNATATVSNTGVIYDSTSVAITNTTPAANSAIATATVSYTLSEQAQGGTVTFTQTGGSTDAGSPHTYMLSGTDLYMGDHTIDTGLILVDGAVYTVSFNATDMAGNAATTVSNAMVLFDNIHDITVTITGSGIVIPSGATGVSHGDARTFTATPDPGYHIASITGCGGNLTGNTFTTGAITADCAVTASYAIDTFIVTPTAGSGGAITPSIPQTLNYGSTASFTITPNTNYHVANILVDGVSAGAVTTYTFTNGTANHTISVTFAVDTFAVNFVSGSNGTLTGTASQTINYGGSATAVTAVPPTGNHFVNWTGTGGFVTTTSNPLTVTSVTAAQSITANFAIDTFTVTPTAGSGGAITPSTPQTLNYGSTASFTVTPNTGYHITAATGCGGTLSGSIYTTGAITGNCNVTATFAIDDTTAPAFTSTSPAANSVINTVTVGYTLSEAVASGKITFARTGGSADSASHIYNFTGSDKTVGTHSVNTALSLINAGIYTVTFEAADLAGNAATVVSNTGVVYDNTSASVVINSPSSNSRTNSVSVSYTLNEEITSGEIVFTRTGGTADGLSPRKHTLGASENSSGSHTPDTGITLIDGAVYTVAFENVTDKAGNATASVSNTSITYDSTAVAITNTSPASNGIITTSSVGYTLSEAALSGKVTFTRSGGSADSGSPHVYTLSGSDLYPGSHTVNTNLSLVDGTFYTLSFDATDMAGNPATTVSNAMVFYDSSYGTGPTGNVDNISYSSKRVDGYDLIKLSIAFGSHSGSINWNPVCDLNADGNVDGNDLMILGNHFGEVQ